MIAEALAGLVFLPLLGACALLVLPAGWRAMTAVTSLAPLPLLLWPITALVHREGTYELAVAGFEAPLGIVWRVDALAVSLLWLNAAVGLGIGLAAARDFAPATQRGTRFWALWLLLIAAINALLLSADLFNLYVTLELVTLASIGLLVIEGKPKALRAAIRYLLLALLGSLLYLLGVALIYGQAGTLDMYQVSERLPAELLGVVALALMTAGLLLKSAIFPLHGWLPAAHGNAPGPVSAVLSAMVVKVSIYMIWRLWLWMAADWPLAGALPLLAALGAGAILYGSALALLAVRLKMLVAYSTVAQLGYLMLVFGLLDSRGFLGASYHLLSHGLAKAAMFLAVANLLGSLGTDRMDPLAGADRRRPIDVFAFALAGVSILGLPPSGGFIAKWLLLQAVWQHGGWIWGAVILAGGLLAAGYLFRALALLCARPVADADAEAGAPAGGRTASLVALGLALAALVAGFVPAPILDFLSSGLPPAVLP